MKAVLKFWLDRGVDGFRVDAVHWLVKDAKLRDNPPNPDFAPGSMDPYHALLQQYTQGQEETLSILKELCQFLDGFGEKFMVTELHAGIEEMARYYRVCGNGRHSPFNFNLIGMPWRVDAYRKFITEFEASLKPYDWPNYVLGNHDQPRVASRLGLERARLAAMLQFTLRGMPFIYYGEEIGMVDGLIPHELVRDQYEKNVPGMKLGRDPERTPMQWNALEYAGFSTSQPWLPVSENYTHVNAEAEFADTRSVLALYKNLIKLRQDSPALLFGRFEPLVLADEEVFAYMREGEGERVAVLLNFSDQARAITLPAETGTMLLTTYMDRPAGEAAHLRNFLLRPHEGYIIKI